MNPTTSGRFRVLGDPHGEWLLVDRETTDPIAVSGGEGLEPGYLIEATVEWDDGDATLAEWKAVAETRIHFVGSVTNLFEVARDLCEDARLQGEAVLGKTTRSTDNEPNGAVYVFAEQSGARDLWEEFRTGAMPLEPLVERLSDHSPEPYEIFVLDPVDEPFVVVYLVPDPDSMLAETVRDTYL
ncbi:DUF6663 family protein [Halalkalicoccus ordinarius]|uniref:DUF6663 family protein n=1 Tax=Halalkalicoccus ordinarius TaxID=3116651 RepID=UPI00300E9FBD